MNIIAHVEACEACNLRENVPLGCTPVFGDGYSDADLVVVLDNPTDMDVLYGIPKGQAALDYLYKIAGEVGIDKTQIFVTNLIKCPGKILKKNIEACKENLIGQTYAIQPKIVATLGTKANKVEGMWPIGTKVFRGQSPSYVMERGKAKQEEFKELFMRIAECLNQNHSA